MTLWHLGYPEQALQRSHEAIMLAQELAHPYSLSYALHNAAMLHCLRREGQAAQARAEATIALARPQEFMPMVARGTILRGWALAAQGQWEEGVAQMRQGLAALHAAGIELIRPYALALLAEAYESMGQAAEGLRLLGEALALAHKYGACFHEAELNRLRGEWLPRQAVGATGRSPLVAEAETCFHQALDIARHQEAKSLELRAAMSLAHLWQRRSKRAEAQQLLAEIYGWFTEGFDTADLKEAKALLAELT